ncbi:MAG: glycosyltransferase family 2 protein [Chlorobi bacterium]|nr:glycosyltransferase family 2 protein [Chlorobiota bacterium]
MKKIKIALVFPIFNGLDFTKTCLSHLSSSFDKIDQGRAMFEIVITDDGSVDNSREWIKKHYPNVHVLQGDGSLWWSGGINLAMDFAIDELGADYILWWNNDILPSGDYFKNLIGILETVDEKTIIGSKIYYADKKEIIWSMGGLFDQHTGAKSMMGNGAHDSEEFNEPRKADWLAGMGTVFHVSVCGDIGMLDNKNFPQYHGDADFTLRAKNQGYDIIVYPGLRIYNDKRQSGLQHGESLKRLLESLVSVRSNYNIKKDFKFYKVHTNNLRAYIPVTMKYLNYIGGFFKWKALGLLGTKRKQ